MTSNDNSSILTLIAVPFVPLFLGLVLMQGTTSGKKLEVNAGETQASKVAKAESSEIQRRTFAVALITSLAREAQGYEDDTLRTRILARAADTLWPADDHAARLLFRRAWETAVKADANKQQSSSNLPPMALSLQRRSGRDLRAEVLSLAARRDRALGEEFLAKLAEEDKRAAFEKRDSSARDTTEGWSSSDASIKRLLLARRLLDNGQIERALEFAEPALHKVNANTIEFLAALRVRRPDIADERFANLLSLSELDPSSDANTVSGLSSYVFTPNFYVTFSADGSPSWSQREQTETPLDPPVLPAALLNRFFRTAASILLRPLPPPEQDFTSSGRIGKAMVLKRLLPLFEQYDTETAAVLRSKLTVLMAAPFKSTIGDDYSLLTEGLPRARTGDDLLTEMQERLDRAKTSQERDSVYGDTVTRLANQGDARALELIDKIDKPTLRTAAGSYVLMQLIQLAIKQKDQAEVLRLAKAEHLTHIQRAWAYMQVARLSLEPDLQQSLRMLEEAANEARRIDASDPDRARSLVAVATQLATADRVRAWEIMAEAVKAANSAPQFGGADMTLRYGLVTNSGLKLGSVGGADFGLSGVFRLLAKEDLYRSLDLAKSFKGEAPRATATLAIVNQLLEQ